MPRFLTDQDARLMLEMCVDAEAHCDQRVQEARAKGDSHDAADAIQQKEKYEALKRRIVAEMQGDQASLMEDSVVFTQRVRDISDKK
jgi:transcription elongation GreA/GreB family factor